MFHCITNLSMEEHICYHPSSSHFAHFWQWREISQLHYALRQHLSNSSMLEANILYNPHLRFLISVLKSSHDPVLNIQWLHTALSGPKKLSTAWHLPLLLLNTILSPISLHWQTQLRKQPPAPPIAWNKITTSDFKGQKRLLFHLH